MPFLRLKSQADRDGLTVNGRAYFENAARELGLSELDSVAIQKSAEALELKPGRRESRFGGRIARNLKHLSAEETAERRRRSERFLKQPDQTFPAEEEKQTKNPRN
jgi:hypothetical protein